MAFVKLDTGILTSTLWMQRTVREVFITALLMAEPWETEEPTRQLEVGEIKETGFEVPAGWYGFVRAAGVGIVHQARVGVEEGMEALRVLGAPDPESRSKDYEGRRMIRVDGGFLILNYMKYRERDHTAKERSRRYRERLKEEKLRRSVTFDTVDDGVATRNVTQAEAEAEAEKREKNTSPDGEVSAGPSGEVPTPTVTFVTVFPCSGTGKREVGITQAQVDGWREAFPAVDVEQALRNMKAWLEANPGNRKTARGVPAFVVRWLTKEQNRAAKPGNGGAGKGNDRRTREADDAFLSQLDGLEAPALGRP